jgi:ABC-type cobalamin/Fe3+-siderophores transport system ATPase subunit
VAPRPALFWKSIPAIGFSNGAGGTDAMQVVQEALGALRDVSFRIEPCAHVGIFGMTGAGKTTLVSLLVRFFDPASGRVLLDGVDLGLYRLADLRRQVASCSRIPCSSPPASPRTSGTRARTPAWARSWPPPNRRTHISS